MMMRRPEFLMMPTPRRPAPPRAAPRRPAPPRAAPRRPAPPRAAPRRSAPPQKSGSNGTYYTTSVASYTCLSVLARKEPKRKLLL